LQIWIAEHLDKKLSVEILADRMAMSARNFERGFTREVGTTAGFNSVDLMRSAFVRLLGITPGNYRGLAAKSRS